MLTFAMGATRPLSPRTASGDVVASGLSAVSRASLALDSPFLHGGARTSKGAGMNVSQFDRLSKTFANAAKRRHVLLGLGSLTAGGLLGHRQPAHAQDNGEDNCPCGWQRVYENQDDGTALSGDISVLVDAVRSGADVKVAYTRPAESGDVEWFRTCASATTARLADGETPVVSCLLTDIPDSNLDIDSGRYFVDPFALEWQAYNTTGTRHVVKFNAQTHDLEENEMDNLSIGWYIRR
jgi:hypothetical protein